MDGESQTPQGAREEISRVRDALDIAHATIDQIKAARDEAMGLLQEWYDDSGIQAVYTPHTGSIVGRTAALLKRMEDET